MLSNVLLQQFTILPIFKKAATGVTTVNGSNDLLGQNYPNPVTNNTTIEFASKGGMVTIQLFDATGRLVRTLLQQEYERGKHQVTLERDALVPGVYFYRLTNGSDQATRQMLVN